MLSNKKVDPLETKKAVKNLDLRVQKIVFEFLRLYPTVGSELNFQSPYELVVSVALSAQCTDKKVNEITPILFKKYKNFKELSKAEISDVEEIIRPINYYKTKSKNIIQLAKTVYEEMGSELPKTHEELQTLSGVGRKTANVVLGELGITESMPVDTHVFRVSKRLEFATGKDANSVEQDLVKLFPKEIWYPLHHWLIYHGRRVCKAQNPDCVTCTLNKLCPGSRAHSAR